MIQRIGWHRIALVLLLGLSAVANLGCGPGDAATLSYSQKNADVVRAAFKGSGGGAVAGPGEVFDSTNRTPQWTSIKGVIKVDDPTASAVATLSAIPVSKETQICGTSAPNEAIEVNASNGGIKNVLIYLNSSLPVDFDEETPVWVHPSYSFNRIAAGEYTATIDQQKPQVDFDQKRCIFLSHVFAMRTDQRMNIINSDNTLHNTNIDAKRGKKDSTSISANSSLIYQPTAQEDSPISVSCNVHPWMTAKMIVRDNPYFAVTDENGAFEIPHVPAGVELEFRLWQEKAGFVSDTVKLNGADLKLRKGRFKQQLEGDEMGKSATWNLEFSSSSFN